MWNAGGPVIAYPEHKAALHTARAKLKNGQTKHANNKKKLHAWEEQKI
jgi:hypothetical protein